MLAPTDYEITEAENGEEALAAIAKKRPDLILMDNGTARAQLGLAVTVAYFLSIIRDVADAIEWYLIDGNAVADEMVWCVDMRAIMAKHAE
jgi:DNA-binding NarL/FixJ family response regulator